MANDKELHHREVLITLDYLLNHTDELHPATTEAICKFASSKYGLQYNGAGKSMEGNEIDRRRIGNLLHYLDDFCGEYELPFVLQQTSGGKYYVEQKNYLNEDQIAKVLAAVVNDKYTHDEDTEFLVNRLLEVLSTSEYNRKFLEDNYKKLINKTRKIDILTNKKIKAIKKAYDEKRAICLLKRFVDDPIKKPHIVGVDVVNKRTYLKEHDERIYCRVYRIEEHNNKPYAILLPIVHKGIIFDAIENLNIPVDLPARELFNEDEENDDRLEQLFQMNNRIMTRFYHSLDEYIDKQIMPDLGYAFKTSFYFDYRHVELVKRSFEEFFGVDMPLVRCNSMTIRDEDTIHGTAIELPRGNDEYAINCEPVPDGESAKYGVVNITINRKAFLEWLCTSPDIALVIDVVAPKSLNKQLAMHHLGMFLKYKDYMEEDTIEAALKTGKFLRSGIKNEEKK